MKVLVTGGAGYIGSHAVKRLLADGHRVVVVDNLQRGHEKAITQGARIEQIDLRQTAELTQLLRDEAIECVMHFAALAYVGESVDKPLMYYDNNTAGTVSLLDAMDQAQVRKLVFSSTCATYGEPRQMPITEDTPQNPINPYGRSKLMVEHVLKDYAAATPEFAYAALRYFNVAGSAADGLIGEDHSPETHLIPVILEAAMGKRKKIAIFGDDYDTPDGTCVRDYIHVEDLVDAHVKVMEHLQPGDHRFYNLGIGKGYSVKEVIDAAMRVTVTEIEVERAARRPGDPPQLYANADKIHRELGWQPRYTDIDEIIATAWAWFRAHPNGYED